MTERERVRPDIINSSRKKRIAAGSGTSVEEVNRLLKQYEQTKDLMQAASWARSEKRAKSGRYPAISRVSLESEDTKP